MRSNNLYLLLLENHLDTLLKEKIKISKKQKQLRKDYNRWAEEWQAEKLQNEYLKELEKEKK